MQEQIWTFLSNITRRMPNLDFTSVIEILIIAFLTYHILIWIKNTRAWSLLKGLALILAFVMVAVYFQMTTILWLARNIMSFAIMAMIVVLQPELRKALEDLGNRDIIANILPFVGTKTQPDLFNDKTINEITKACVEMAKVRTGALIVVECKQPLGDFERTGIEVDGLVSSQLLINIFEHNTPLHDGAVIVRGNRCASATCYLPLTDNMGLDKTLGTRHRAGVGITEVTDAVVVIVSEQTGKISFAHKGVLERNLDGDKLREKLKIAQPDDSEGAKKSHRIWKGRSKVDKVEKENKDRKDRKETVK